MILLLPPTNERQQCVNSFCAGTITYTATKCIALYLNWFFNAQSFQYVLVYNITTMHAMTHRAYIFVARSPRVNIEEPVFLSTIRYLSTSFQVQLPSCQIPTTMPDSKSLNTLLLEVMISSKNEHVFIRDLNDLTLQIIFDAWWASMNVSSMRSIAWKDCRHAPWWRSYLHCGIEKTGSPGIICIVCHRVLCHPSEHGTSSMGKHVLAKEHITELNELTESEVTDSTSSKVGEAALAIPKWQGSCRITIVSLERKFIVDIDF